VTLGYRRDSLGIVCANPVTYEAEWAGVFRERHGGTAAANLRTVSKGSSRGAGPKKKQGRQYRAGGAAEDVRRCPHGQRMVRCEGCSAWHCGCPGSPAHGCVAGAL
jgi:hypothetical protein